MVKLGLIGKPSDWLIASTYDKSILLSRMGMEIVDIPIEEVTSLGEVESGLLGAQRIYERIRDIVSRYQLDGVTLRCFDLLTTVRNTGCIALSRLNDEGIPAACEGDVPTLVTMLLAKQLSGCPGFQCNPARIEQTPGQAPTMLFAHCTLPLSMCQSYSLTTHFESGIGVAIHGELPTGDYTLMKVSGDLSRVFVSEVTLIRNQYERNLCRTQVWLQMSDEDIQYFLTNPIANHHVLVPGKWSKKINHL